VVLTADLVPEILIALAGRMRPWPDVEAALAAALPGVDPYLGGDGLRPYACWADDQKVHVTGVRREDLPLPPLTDEVLGGAFGMATMEPGQPGVYVASVGRGEPLMRRLDVPELLMIGLGDADRYRGARLSLGVARLSQWLRFTHSARVTVVDYTIATDPRGTVMRALASQQFDIVGVSVNFGQWRMLEDLAAMINAQPLQPIVVLGNILASFSPDPASAMFDAARHGRVLVATSLGERPLERLCRERRHPDAWDGIDGLIRPRPGVPTTPSRQRVKLPELVFPDDGLVLTIAERGGQISLETSFGCQYGACTFCPRDHRGEGWSRGHQSAAVAALERVASSGAVVSLVDEEFFGSEGLIDPPLRDLPAASILEACRRLGITYEIYTRLEQLFDRRRSNEWNIERARILATEAPSMRRIFVGVESGSLSQLRRYGKGQTVAQTVDSLRIGSALGVPLEFGFITFDPLLTADQLAENVEFLARTDIIATRCRGDLQEQLDLVRQYLQGADIEPSGTPLYRHVAYMATELEVLARSRYADQLHRRHPDLLDGTYDASFARYGVQYRDDRVGDVAGWCRVWTEGMFVPVYQARMMARAAGTTTSAHEAVALVSRYRDATFALLVGLSSALLPEVATRLTTLPVAYELSDRDDPLAWMRDLAARVRPGPPTAEFDARLRGLRRDR
jgi:radical SAM superfamily enzyme YgiQ (UPF0313 family)